MKMGEYLNPGNEAFRGQTAEETFVDKTGMIPLINAKLGTTKRFVCVSRPRKFGKTWNAEMLCAYYGRGCDSRDLFQNLAVARDPSFEEHLNGYEVILVNLRDFASYDGRWGDLPSRLQSALTEEIRRQYPEVEASDQLLTTLRRVVDHTGHKVFLILDNWDAPFEEEPLAREGYLRFLGTLFGAGSRTAGVFAGVFLTGVLPICRLDFLGALTCFSDCSCITDREFGPYFGFTEREAERFPPMISEKHGIDPLYVSNLDTMYGGYTFGTVGGMYNPYDMARAVETGNLDYCWRDTLPQRERDRFAESFRSITTEPRERDRIRQMIGFGKIQILPRDHRPGETALFMPEDTLTLWVHLGWLTSRPMTEEDPRELTEGGNTLFWIPNNETLGEFTRHGVIYLAENLPAGMRYYGR